MSVDSCIAVLYRRIVLLVPEARSFGPLACTAGLLQSTDSKPYQAEPYYTVTATISTTMDRASTPSSTAAPDSLRMYRERRPARQPSWFRRALALLSCRGHADEEE